LNFSPSNQICYSVCRSIQYPLIFLANYHFTLEVNIGYFLKRALTDNDSNSDAVCPQSGGNRISKYQSELICVTFPDERKYAVISSATFPILF
jgi:hypothetical protein